MKRQTPTTRYDWIIVALSLCLALASIVRGAMVSVRDFGAVPGDGKDDVAAFEMARNAAGAGGTINVPAGVYNFARQFDPGAARSYVGQTAFHCENWKTPFRTPLRFILDTSSTIRPIGDFHAIRITSSNVSLRGLTIDGRGVWMENSIVAIDNITIDGCWFKLFQIATGDHKSAIQFQTWLTNSRITNNVFDPIDREVGIYGYKWANLVIANNAFMNGVEGIHTVGKGDVRDLLIQQNYFGNLSRMGGENQESGWNSILEDNWYESPKAFGADTMAYSFVHDQSVNAIARRNVHLSPLSANTPNQLGVVIVFELGGKNFLCEDNFSDGGNHVVAVNGAGATGIVRNNQLSGFREGPRNANGATATFVNNGPTVQLSWDINRGRPGPFRRYGEPDPAPPIVIQSTPPATAPTTSPIDDLLELRLRRNATTGKLELSPR